MRQRATDGRPAGEHTGDSDHSGQQHQIVLRTTTVTVVWNRFTKTFPSLY
jgi:hypothetical protein